MKSPKLVVLFMTIMLICVSIFGLVACNNNLPSNVDSNILAVYGLYKASAESRGEEVKSYEDWYAELLELARGEKGDKGEAGTPGENGITPHIGDDGYWYFGSEKTEYKAVGADGQNGTNGITPTIGDDGFWYFGSEKTEYKAVGADGQNGKDGITPHIGDDGNWWIGNSNTGIKAQGEKGTNGENGEKGENGKSAYDIWKENGNDGTEEDFLNSLKGEDGAKGETGANGEKGERGNGWTFGHGVPSFTNEELKNTHIGDLYLDLDTWDVWTCEPASSDKMWVKQGNIRGPVGPQGPAGSGSAGDLTNQQVNVTNDSYGIISLEKLTKNTTHIVVADLEKKLETGRIQAQVDSDGSVLSELVYSETRSNEVGEGHYIYFGYIYVPEGASNAKVYAKGEDVKATITFEDYEIPTLTLDGDPIDICVNAYGTSAENLIKFKIDPSIEIGTYSVIVSFLYADHPLKVQMGIFTIFIGNDTKGKSLMVTGKQFDNPKDFKITEKTYNDENNYVYLSYTTNPNHGEFIMTYPLTIQLKTKQ